MIAKPVLEPSVEMLTVKDDFTFYDLRKMMSAWKQWNCSVQDVDGYMKSMELNDFVRKYMVVRHWLEIVDLPRYAKNTIGEILLTITRDHQDKLEELYRKIAVFQ